MITTFNFPAEEDSVCIRKKQLSLIKHMLRSLWELFVAFYHKTFIYSAKINGQIWGESSIGLTRCDQNWKIPS